MLWFNGEATITTTLSYHNPWHDVSRSIMRCAWYVRHPRGYTLLFMLAGLTCIVLLRP